MSVNWGEDRSSNCTPLRGKYFVPIRSTGIRKANSHREFIQKSPKGSHYLCKPSLHLVHEITLHPSSFLIGHHLLIHKSPVFVMRRPTFRTTLLPAWMALSTHTSWSWALKSHESSSYPHSRRDLGLHQPVLEALWRRRWLDIKNTWLQAHLTGRQSNFVSG